MSNGKSTRFWNGFQQVLTTSYLGLKATAIVPTTFAVINQAGNSQFTPYIYRFTFAGALPAWLQVGARVKIAASVSPVGVTAAGGGSVDVSGTYTVRAIDTVSGLYFDVDALFAPTAPNGPQFTIPFSVAVDNGSGTVTSPTVTLSLTQVKKVKFLLSGSAGLLAPTVDSAGVTIYPVTLSTTVEYVLEAPTDEFMDISRMSVKTTSTGTVLVMIL